MRQVVVLASDWDGGADPVTYYSTDPNGCLDFESQPAKPRVVLSESGRKNLPDCIHAVSYPVVICDVQTAAASAPRPHK